MDTKLPTPIYQGKRATLYCADCLDVMPLLKGVDAVVTDPPYGVAFSYGACGKSAQVQPKHLTHKDTVIIGDDVDFDPSPILKHYYKKNARIPIVFFGANHYSDKLPKGELYCWDKSCGMGAAALFADAEFIWSNRRSARKIYRHFWMGALRQGEDASCKCKRLHISQKPVELMAWLIETLRIGVGKTVLDPYMGSGSTGVACIRTGRRFVGIEIDPGHAAAAAERIARIEKEVADG